jgi:hypothetical protein
MEMFDNLLKGAKEIYYPGAPHGLTATHQDQVNADLVMAISRIAMRSDLAEQVEDPRFVAALTAFSSERQCPLGQKDRASAGRSASRHASPMSAMMSV